MTLLAGFCRPGSRKVTCRVKLAYPQYLNARTACTDYWLHSFASTRFPGHYRVGEA